MIIEIDTHERIELPDKELQAELGISDNYLYQIRTGRRNMPKKHWLRLRDKYGVPLEHWLKAS